MVFQKNQNQVSVNGQDSMYLFNILNNINKFKVLLVFLNKNFTWHRELRSFGIFSKDIEETLNEFNNLGLIEIKELTDLDDVQYETFKSVKNDVQHYFKIYFITKKFYDLISKHQEDCFNVINENEHLLDFIEKVKSKLKPFIEKSNQIMQEETTQLTRTINLNGVTFEKDTLMSKEVQQILKLTSTKTGTDLILQEIKPLALMTEPERRRNTNKVFHNGKEINSSIFREQELKDLEAEKDFETGTIGKSEIELEIAAEKREAGIMDLLGIDE